MAKRRTGRLYRGRGTRRRELRAFRREYPGYSEARVERIYGATVGKVRRERRAKREGGSMSGHWRAHRHSRGEHPGHCSMDCRRGRVAHWHPGRRRARASHRRLRRDRRRRMRDRSRRRR